MTEERWAEIEGYPLYLVSNFGYVINRDSERILHAYDNGNGYLKVTLYNEGGRESFYIQQLVAAAFFRNFHPGVHVMHVNGDLRNNRSNNLRLRREREPRDKRPNQRNSWGRCVRVIELDQIFDSVRECALAIGGDYSSIYQCLKGNRKKHLGYTFEWY